MWFEQCIALILRSGSGDCGLVHTSTCPVPRKHRSEQFSTCPVLSRHRSKRFCICPIAFTWKASSLWLNQNRQQSTENPIDVLLMVSLWESGGANAGVDVPFISFIHIDFDVLGFSLVSLIIQYLGSYFVVLFWVFLSLQKETLIQPLCWADHVKSPEQSLRTLGAAVHIGPPSSVLSTWLAVAFQDFRQSSFTVAPGDAQGWALNFFCTRQMLHCWSAALSGLLMRANG